MSTTHETIKTFIVENFLFGDDGGFYNQPDDKLNNDTSFLENGIIDSTGILELVAFIEETFNTAIADEELIPENLDSVNRIADFLARKTVGTTMVN